jgi:MFS family permease
VIDLTLSLRRWYLIGLAACVSTLFLLGVMPLRQDAAIALTAVAFLAQVGSTLVSIPVTGLMAHTVAEDRKGRAAGWYQAGNLGGNGFGGGAGVWLASHYSSSAAGAVLAGSMVLCALALRFIPDVSPIIHERLWPRLRLMGKDLAALVRAPLGRMTIVLVACPIGAAAMNNLWSAVAPDWRADANTVALMTGVLSGMLSAVGCVVGGWIADRHGRWWAYYGSGVVMAGIALIMAVTPRTPFAFSTGVLCYAFGGGVAYATFSAMVLYVIGRGAASTKYAMLSSLGNLPVVYMTALNGWAHDRYGTAAMLVIEALAAVVWVILGLAALARLKKRGAA